MTVPMLRAFVAVGDCGNPLLAGEKLKITRQTVYRHLSNLEEVIGAKLFEVKEKRYVLTPDGRDAFDEASFIIQRLETSFGQGRITERSVDGLKRRSFIDSEGRKYLLQQHPVSRVTSLDQKIFSKALTAWGKAAGNLEHSAMKALRPYFVLFRRIGDDWVFVEVGAKSTYALWFGKTWANSAIGRLLDQDNVGSDYNRFIYDDYRSIYHEGGVRLDDIHAHLPREGHDAVPVFFRRLLLGCRFADDEPGLIVLTAPSADVVIDDLEMTPTVPESIDFADVR